MTNWSFVSSCFCSCLAMCLLYHDAHYQVQEDMQELNKCKYRAHRRGNHPSEGQSMQLPAHWDPMRAQEDCRLADICMRPGEEYNGDLEGWEVRWLSLVSVRATSAEVSGLLSGASFCRLLQSHCLLLGQGYVMHSNVELKLGRHLACALPVQTKHLGPHTKAGLELGQE